MTTFKIMSMSGGGAVLGMTNGRVMQFAKRTACHTQMPNTMVGSSASPTGVMTETNTPSNEKIRKTKAQMNQAVRGLEKISVGKKPKRKPIDF